MKLPLYRRLTQEDLNDAPKGTWKEKLLYAVNLFFQQIYEGLSNQLTPEQNCLAQTKTFLITAGSTPADAMYSFVTNFTYQPLGYDLLSIQPTDNSSRVFTVAPHISWSFGNGRFNVLGITGLTDGVVYQVTLRVWWPAVLN